MKTKIIKRSKSWKPHKYQKLAVKFLLEHAAGGLFLDPGMGKTSITLASLKVLQRHSQVSKVLIIAPLRVCYEVWPAEIQKWQDFQHMTYTILHGSKKDERLRDKADIYLINPEGLEWLLGASKRRSEITGRAQITVDLKRFKQLGFDTLVVDELTKFKDQGTNRFKAIKQVLGTFGRRWGLTGSPAANGLMGLFGQCYVLDEGRTFGRYITHYRNKYFLPHPSGFGWVLQDGAADRIYERIRPLVLRLSDEDWVEVPKQVDDVIRVPMDSAQAKIYQLLEDDLIAMVDDGRITAATAGAKSGKLRQVASGAVYLDDEVKALEQLPTRARRTGAISTNKINALLELIEGLQGQPCLVLYEFNHEADRLQPALEHKLETTIPTIRGGMRPSDTKAALERWNSGELPALIAQSSAIYHGLNLQAGGRHLAWFTLPWDYEVYDQVIRRLRRQGSTARSVVNHLILTNDTVDWAVYGALRAKAKGQRSFFSAVMKRLRNR